MSIVGGTLPPVHGRRAPRLHLSYSHTHTQPKAKMCFVFPFFLAHRRPGSSPLSQVMEGNKRVFPSLETAICPLRPHNVFHFFLMCLWRLSAQVTTLGLNMRLSSQADAKDRLPLE